MRGAVCLIRPRSPWRRHRCCSFQARRRDEGVRAAVCYIGERVRSGARLGGPCSPEYMCMAHQFCSMWNSDASTVRSVL